jgi:hypothetical protein
MLTPLQLHLWLQQQQQQALSALLALLQLQLQQPQQPALLEQPLPLLLL